MQTDLKELDFYPPSNTAYSKRNSQCSRYMLDSLKKECKEEQSGVIVDWP